MQAAGQVTVPLSVTEQSVYDLRILNHWDNPDGTVERGYAGCSLWNWEELPGTLSPRYEAYARANASVGINGTVLNNVNASPQVLATGSLEKVKALADVFRPYGIKVYLSVNFASPIQLGKLDTADPLDKEVIRWWRRKVKEIYTLIPDFGGFLVKANSEGQPGPCDFGRTHAEGANMLADALKPYGGIVMWRAFVYSPTDSDRAKQAYLEFMPLDGQFRENVIVQIKNGPIDFQPREPYSPLFTAMKQTPMMVEFQNYSGVFRLFQSSGLFGSFMGGVLWRGTSGQVKSCGGCGKHRYGCELVRTPFCAGQLVCFRAFGMESVVDFRQDCR